MIPKILGSVLLVASALTWVHLGRANDPAIWIPLVVPLPAAGDAAAGRFVADADGPFEIQVEADRTADPAVLDATLGTTSGPGRLQLTWTVVSGAEPIAAGDAAGYLYVERGPRSRIAQLKRVLLRMPYGRNAIHRESFGLRGSATLARGVGRFHASSGSEYEVRVVAGAGGAGLADGAPRLVVRPARRRWQEHFAAARTLGYAALLGALGGVALLVFSFVRVPGSRAR